jgi:nucleoside-diphosphate-sugar epimerase
LKRKILITGGFGFVGAYFAECLLQNNEEVIVLDDSSRGRKSNISAFLEKVQVVDADTRDKKTILDASKGVDSIVHLAAIQGTGNFYQRPHEVLEVNVKGLINTIEAAVANKVKCFFFASSSEAYGNPRVFPTPETQELMIPDISNPRYSYAASKIIGEAFVVNYARHYGFDYTIVRYHNVYGPKMGWDHVIPQFISRLAREEKFTVQGDGTQTRSFCYITDAIDCSVRALLKPEGANEIFNVGNPFEEHSINDLVELLGKIAGRTISPIHIPFPAAGTARRQPDITKATRKLGYQPHVTLEEGLKRTFAWYMNEINRQAQP